MRNCHIKSFKYYTTNINKSQAVSLQTACSSETPFQHINNRVCNCHLFVLFMLQMNLSFRTGVHFAFSLQWFEI